MEAWLEIAWPASLLPVVVAALIRAFGKVIPGKSSEIDFVAVVACDRVRCRFLGYRPVIRP